MSSSFINKIQHGLFSRMNETEGQGPAYLIIGLGNPGREYRETRHNAGFLIIDRLAKDLEIPMTRVQQKALIGSGMFRDKKIYLAKPQTFMNLSGEAVAGLARFYKVPAGQILVAHDDLDLPFGTLRLRAAGSSAGQKGVQSIIERLGTQDFPRLRFGIGRPPGSKQGANYVLQGFVGQEKKELEFLLDKAAAAVKVFIEKGIDEAMNQFNGAHLED